MAEGIPQFVFHGNLAGSFLTSNPPLLTSVLCANMHLLLLPQIHSLVGIQNWTALTSRQHNNYFSNTTNNPIHNPINNPINNPVTNKKRKANGLKKAYNKEYRANHLVHMLQLFALHNQLGFITGSSKEVAPQI